MEDAGEVLCWVMCRGGRVTVVGVEWWKRKLTRSDQRGVGCGLESPCSARLSTDCFFWRSHMEKGICLLLDVRLLGALTLHRMRSHCGLISKLPRWTWKMECTDLDISSVAFSPSFIVMMPSSQPVDHSLSD